MVMCMIVAVMVVMLLVFVGFRVQPGSHVRDLALGIIKTGVEKIFHRCIIRLDVQPAGAGIACEARKQSRMMKVSVPAATCIALGASLR